MSARFLKNKILLLSSCLAGFAFVADTYAAGATGVPSVKEMASRLSGADTTGAGATNSPKGPKPAPGRLEAGKFSNIANALARNTAGVQVNAQPGRLKEQPGRLEEGAGSALAHLFGGKPRTKPAMDANGEEVIAQAAGAAQDVPGSTIMVPPPPPPPGPVPNLLEAIPITTNAPPPIPNASELNGEDSAKIPKGGNGSMLADIEGAKLKKTKVSGQGGASFGNGPVLNFGDMLKARNKLKSNTRGKAAENNTAQAASSTDGTFVIPKLKKVTSKRPAAEEIKAKKAGPPPVPPKPKKAKKAGPPPVPPKPTKAGPPVAPKPNKAKKAGPLVAPKPKKAAPPLYHLNLTV